jgi:hypothetical protein
LLGGLIDGAALIYRPQQAGHATIQCADEAQFALNPGCDHVVIGFFGHVII